MRNAIKFRNSQKIPIPLHRYYTRKRPKFQGNKNGLRGGHFSLFSALNSLSQRITVAGFLKTLLVLQIKQDCILFYSSLFENPLGDFVL